MTLIAYIYDHLIFTLVLMCATAIWIDVVCTSISDAIYEARKGEKIDRGEP